MLSTVFAEGVCIESGLESVKRVENGVQDGEGSEEGNVLVVDSVGICVVDSGVSHQGQLGSVENQTLECTENHSLVHDLGKGVTECRRFQETGLQRGVGLIGHHETIEGCVEWELRLHRKRGMLSWRKLDRVGSFRACRVVS